MAERPLERDDSPGGGEDDRAVEDGLQPFTCCFAKQA